MNNFRWNNVGESVAFWDPNAEGGMGAEFTRAISDKNLLQNPSRAKENDVLLAISRVLVELMEIEEKRR